MTDEEREFWKAAFLAALSTVIRMPWETNGKADPLNAETFAIVAGRIADESLRELREMGDAPNATRSRRATVRAGVNF